MRRARDPVLAFGVWAPSSTLGLRQRSRFPYGHTASLPPGPSRGLREASCVRHGLIPACPEPQAATWGNLSSGSKTQLERQLLRPAFPDLSGGVHLVLLTGLPCPHSRRSPYFNSVSLDS